MSSDTIPAYNEQLSAFHRAFDPELTRTLGELPVDTDSAVLDLACGDGFYTVRLARRLGPRGRVVGVDTNDAYLDAARDLAAKERGDAHIELVDAPVDDLPFDDASFDLIWCAQSLYSLPEPVEALKRVARVLRPGGTLAVLENDTMHQVFLPWPATLELAVRGAELQALSKHHDDPSKFYVGRRLPSVFASAGYEPGAIRTLAIDRQAPLGADERALLTSYLEGVVDRVAPFLDDSLVDELRRLADPTSPDALVTRPHVTMTWLNVLATARKPDLNHKQ